jgi:hypothetical protein
MPTAPFHRWEVFITLDFDWEVFSGKRPWKWSFAAYMTSRILCFTSVILILIVYNITSEINCNVRSHLGALLFNTDGSYSCTVLVAYSPCCVVVRCGYRLVPSRASRVGDLRPPSSFLQKLQADFFYKNLESPSGDDIK